MVYSVLAPLVGRSYRGFTVGWTCELTGQLECAIFGHSVQRHYFRALGNSFRRTLCEAAAAEGVYALRAKALSLAVLLINWNDVMCISGKFQKVQDSGAHAALRLPEKQACFGPKRSRLAGYLQVAGFRNLNFNGANGPASLLLRNLLQFVSF